MKKRNILHILSISAFGGLFMLQSCSKDPVEPPPNTPTTEVKPYIFFNGFKYQCAKQEKLAVEFAGGDSILVWIGTGSFDTSLSIGHNAQDIKVGSYTIDSTVAPDKGFVTIKLRWGNNLSSPFLNFAKGSYEIKKEGGKYVSYLKNGEAWNGNDHTERYKNIEFKVIWPY